MRVRPIRLLLALLACSLVVVGQTGQSVLNFPYAVTPDSVRSVGFAFVNPTSSPAVVTLKSFCTAPNACTVGDETGAATVTIPARGQVANLYSELLPNSVKGGWVQASSSTPGIVGFEALGDFVQMVDGVESSVSAADQVLPIVSENTTLYAINSATSSITLTLRFYDSNGGEITPAVVRTLPSHGSMVLDIKVGQSPSYTSVRHVRATATGAFSAMAVVRDVLPELSGPYRDFGAITATDFAQLGKELNFPHVSNGSVSGLLYTTIVGVTNATSQVQNLSLTYRVTGGGVATVSRTLAPNGSLKESIDTLFGPSSVFEDGWIQITGSGQLAGFAAITEKTASGLAVIGVPRPARTSLLFAQIADLNPWQTGVTLLNPNPASASVEVFAMNADGTLIGGAQNVPTARFELAGQTKVAKLLSDWIPQTQKRFTDGGFIFVRTTNSVPLHGLELFFLRNGKAFANVAASPSGAYQPPFPTPPTISSVSPSSVMSGIARGLTVTGVNFEPGFTATVTTPNGTLPVGPLTFVSSEQIRVGVFMQGPPSGQDSYEAILRITNPGSRSASAAFTVTLAATSIETGAVAGRITSASSNETVGGIEVIAVSLTGGTITVSDDIQVTGFERKTFKTQTDADGNFLLEGLPVGVPYFVAPFRQDLIFKPQVFSPPVRAGQIWSVEFVASLSDARPAVWSAMPKAARCGTRPSPAPGVPADKKVVFGAIRIAGSDFGLGTVVFVDSEGVPVQGVKYYEIGYNQDLRDPDAPFTVVGQFVCDGAVKNGVHSLAINTPKGLSRSISFPIQLPPRVTAVVARDPSTGQTLSNVARGQSVHLEVTGTDLNDTAVLRLGTLTSQIELPSSNLNVSPDGTFVRVDTTIPTDISPASYSVMAGLDGSVMSSSSSSVGTLIVR